MVRPRHFRPNPDTAEDNAFQRSGETASADDVAHAAYGEVTQMAAQLERAGVRVHMFDDDAADRPDAVFPNNWFSTHAGGHIAVYPMFAESRRRERRWDIIETLKREYRVQDVIDYSGLEPDGVFLEGTGAMVLDHIERIAYAVRSNRTDPVALERFCTNFNFEPMAFDAIDVSGQRVYHTNVVMWIGTDIAMAGFELMTDAKRRTEIADRLAASGRQVLALTPEQINEFAGNAMELQGHDGRLLAISARALRSLTDTQVAALEAVLTILPLDVSTIELAGGSVRCMLAGIHLAPRAFA